MSPRKRSEKAAKLLMARIGSFAGSIFAKSRRCSFEACEFMQGTIWCGCATFTVLDYWHSECCAVGITRLHCCYDD